MHPYSYVRRAVGNGKIGMGRYWPNFFPSSSILICSKHFYNPVYTVIFAYICIHTLYLYHPKYIYICIYILIGLEMWFGWKSLSIIQTQEAVFSKQKLKYNIYINAFHLMMNFFLICWWKLLSVMTLYSVII